MRIFVDSLIVSEKVVYIYCEIGDWSLFLFKYAWVESLHVELIELLIDCKPLSLYIYTGKIWLFDERKDEGPCVTNLECAPMLCEGIISYSNTECVYYVYNTTLYRFKRPLL